MNSPSSIIRDLQKHPGSFAFSQAVELGCLLLRSYGVAAGKEQIRYRVNPSLAFPPGDIDSLRVVQDATGKQPPFLELVVNILGLHGASSPLPAYFTEYVSQHQDEPSALQDFFDIFHQRLLELFVQTTRKYRYHARYLQGAHDLLSQRFFSFIGLGLAEQRQSHELRWPRLMAYMGLIAFNGESAGSLESILRHYFSHSAISIIPCIRRWVQIPSDQQTHLGSQNSVLSTSFLLGTQIADQTGKFRICISDLSWERFNSFLPSGPDFNELQTLVGFVLRSRLDFDIELHLRPEELPVWKLESHNPCKLGWSAWAGKGGNGIITLNSHFRKV